MRKTCCEVFLLVAVVLCADPTGEQVVPRTWTAAQVAAYPERLRALRTIASNEAPYGR